MANPKVAAVAFGIGKWFVAKNEYFGALTSHILWPLFLIWTVLWFSLNMYGQKQKTL